MLEIRYHPQVKKEIKRIPSTRKKQIKEVIHGLAKDPNKGKRLRGRLEGMRSYHAGNYRIIYLVEGATLYILSVSHRRDVYEESARRRS